MQQAVQSRYIYSAHLDHGMHVKYSDIFIDLRFRKATGTIKYYAVPASHSARANLLLYIRALKLYINKRAES